MPRGDTINTRIAFDCICFCYKLANFYLKHYLLSIHARGHSSFCLLICQQMPVTGGAYGGRSFDDAETYFGNNKQAGKARGLPDNNVLKSFAPEKEKASNVAKIKVVVC